MARFSRAGHPELDKAVRLFREKTVGKNVIDYRLPENRRRAFQRYYNWRVTTYDLDHTHYLNVLAEGYDFERKAWLAMLFGMTYRTPQAFSYAETFEHPNKFSAQEVDEWHRENWQRTTYGTDARYNKGHFVKQYESVKKWLNGASFKEKFDSILIHDSSLDNFKAMYREVQSLYKYGRMTGWLALQGLYDLLKLDIDPHQILLEGYNPQHDSSLGSIWNGLCALTNKEELQVGKYGNHEITKEDLLWGGPLLIEETNQAGKLAGKIVDSFRNESIWCQYKRLYNKDMSLEYGGHASGDATSRYLYYREHWPELNWEKFRRALRTQPGIVKGQTFVPWKNQFFGHTGQLFNLHEIYEDELNLWEVCEIDPQQYLVKELWTDDGLPVPTSQELLTSFKEDIKTAPKYWREV